MPNQYLGRFARVLIKNNGYLGSFEVDVLERDFAQDLVAEFRSIGCEATLDDYNAIVKIDCPPDVLKTVLSGAEMVSAP